MFSALNETERERPKPESSASPGIFVLREHFAYGAGAAVFGSVFAPSVVQNAPLGHDGMWKRGGGAMVVDVIGGGGSADATADADPVLSVAVVFVVVAVLESAPVTPADVGSLHAEVARTGSIAPMADR